MKKLLDEQPLLIMPKLAKEIGLNESIILQQIHYWLLENKQNKRNFKEGRYWTYNTYKDWQEQFPFWSISTIRRTLTSLENSGYIVTDSFNKFKFDKTKWYSIEYTKLNKGSVQNEQTEDTNLNKPIPETNSETNKQIFTVADATDKVKLYEIVYKRVFNEAPRSTKFKEFTNDTINDLDLYDFGIQLEKFFKLMKLDESKCTIEYVDKSFDRLIRD